MKTVLLVSGNPEVQSIFKPISNSKKFKFETVTWDEWRAEKKLTNGHLVYLDISGLSEAEMNRYFKKVQSLHSPWGVVDRENRITDVAGLFHDGVCDYIDTNCLDSVKVKRIQQVWSFHDQRSPNSSTQTPPAKASAGARSGELSRSWNNVVPGREYTFSFMYIELLPSKEWSKKAADSHQEQMQSAFHDMVESHASEYNGRVWMWNDWGGVVLFPFDGTKCQAAVLATRLLLNRVILSIEGGPFQTLLDYKIALHIGDTVYQQRGKTGTIVSDDVNFIFHMGAKFAEPNRVYATSKVRNAIQTELHSIFKPLGAFEGQQIFGLDSPFSH